MTLFVHGMLHSDPLALSDAIAEVLYKSFQHKLILEHFFALSDVPIPPGWSKELAVDCEHLSYVLAIAYLNHSMIVFSLPLTNLTEGPS